MMQTIRPHHEPETVDGYVSTLETRLRRALPHDKAAQITEETEAHLSDRVDDLMDTGLTQQEAEATALSGFGRVRTYARTAIENAYADRTSQRWRLVGRLGLANFLAFTAVRVMYPTNEMASSIVAPALGGLALFLVSTLASRRPQTRQIVALSAVTLLAIIGIAGVRYVPNPDTPPLGLESIKYSTSGSRHGAPGLPRGEYDPEIAHEKRRLRHLYYETNVIQQGLQVYTQGKPVPASLRSDGRYIVPLPYDAEWNTMSAALDMSAFKTLWPDEWLANYESQMNTQPFPTVATPKEAARLWAERGPLWLAGKHRRIAYWNGEFATMKHAQTAPLGFNATASAYHGYRLLQLCLTLMALDFILAYLGRAVWITTRNRRHRGVA